MQAVGNRGTYHESTRFSTNYFRDALTLKVLSNSIDGSRKPFRIFEQRCNVFKNHAWLWVIRNIGNIALKIKCGHRSSLV